MEGVDYSTARPSPAGLYAAGKRFAARYGGAGTSPKWLTLTEARALIDAGLSIVANVEGTASGLLGGYGVGVQWAAAADRHFQACGMPVDRPIYLSVDFDVQASQWGIVADALRGAAAVIGADRVGVYGGRNAIRWAQRDHVARWFWQTYAWSGTPTQWLPGVHVQQYRNGVTVAGGDCDLNRAWTVDFGQWPITQQEGGNDMANADDVYKLLLQVDERVGAFTQGMDARPSNGEKIWPTGAVKGIQEDLTALTPGVIDYDALAAALKPVVVTAVEDVIARTGLTVQQGS